MTRVTWRARVAEAVHALDGLDLAEIGSRRRLSAALEVHEGAIRNQNLTQEAINLLNRCLVKTEDAGWLGRCRSFIQRLESQ